MDNIGSSTQKVKDNFDVNLIHYMLSYLDLRLPWQRRLWSFGSIAVLEDLISSIEYQNNSIIDTNSIKSLRQDVVKILKNDKILEYSGLKNAALTSVTCSNRFDKEKDEIYYNSVEFYKIVEILDTIKEAYKTSIISFLKSDDKIKFSAERISKNIISYFIETGYSKKFLFGKFRKILEDKNLKLEDEILDIIENNKEIEHEALICFSSLSLSSSEIEKIEHFYTSKKAAEWLKANNFFNVRQHGGLLFKIKSKDENSLLSNISEIFDRINSRISIGSKIKASLIDEAFIKGFKNPLKIKKENRDIKIHSFSKRSKLFPTSNLMETKLDHVIELLNVLDKSNPGAATASGWSAIESLLISKGDSKILAANRISAIICCSYLRAELTTLSYSLEKKDLPQNFNELSNVEKSRHCLTRLKNHQTNFKNYNDEIGKNRVLTFINNPKKFIEEIKFNASYAFKAFYRQRNIVVHGGKSHGILMTNVLNVISPLVSAAFDRIIHAYEEGTEPLEIVAKAETGLMFVEENKEIDFLTILHS